MSVNTDFVLFIPTKKKQQNQKKTPPLPLLQVLLL